MGPFNATYVLTTPPYTPTTTNHPLYFHLSGSGMGAGHVGRNVKNVSPEAACSALVGNKEVILLNSRREAGGGLSNQVVIETY